MLHCRSNTKSALIQTSQLLADLRFGVSSDISVTAEPSSEFPVIHTRRCSYAELYELVTALVSALLQHGVQPGDRVASYSSNCIVSVPTMILASRPFIPHHVAGCDSQFHLMIHIRRKMWQLALLQRLLVVSGSVLPPNLDQKVSWNGRNSIVSR